MTRDTNLTTVLDDSKYFEKLGSELEEKPDADGERITK